MRVIIMISDADGASDPVLGLGLFRIQSLEVKGMNQHVTLPPVQVDGQLKPHPDVAGSHCRD
jgi:hypothetical protein